LKPELFVLGAFMTMFDRRNSLSWEIVKEVRQNFPYYVFETIIPRNVCLAEAPSFGKSILEYDQHSQGARSYESLAREFLDVAVK
jgi:chromosome partitioning protein